MRKFIVLTVVAMLLISGAFMFAMAQGDEADNAQKLDTIIENQKTILAELASMKNELTIIKIRITQAQ